MNASYLVVPSPDRSLSPKPVPSAKVVCCQVVSAAVVDSSKTLFVSAGVVSGVVTDSS